MEQPVNALVDVGFRIGQFPAECVHFGPLRLQVRFPFVGRARGGERVVLPLEARLQTFAERHKLQTRPLLRQLVELAAGVFFRAEVGRQPLPHLLFDPVTLVAEGVASLREPGELMPSLLGVLKEPLRGLVASLRWKLTPYYSVEMMTNATDTVLLRQKFDFCAAHRLNVASLSLEENRRLFGKCNDPSGHGHNYVLELSVRGPVDALNGMVINIKDVDTMLKALLAPIDHRMINVAMPEFAAAVPTTEALAQALWKRIPPKM